MARKKRAGRDLNGILLLDKPTGISSNRALQMAARLFSSRKAGHTGSLDPLASGMLPICFGEATKVSGFLLDSDKAYTVTARLGVVTDSGDADGDVVERSENVDVNRSALEAALEQFRGPIEQIPPMYSALKHKGQPLYKLARKGQVIERKPRPVIIRHLELLELKNDQFSLYIECGKGTYIRSLVVDIGAALGCGIAFYQLSWLVPGLAGFAALAAHPRRGLVRDALPIALATAATTLVLGFALREGLAAVWTQTVDKSPWVAAARPAVDDRGGALFLAPVDLPDSELQRYAREIAQPDLLVRALRVPGEFAGIQLAGPSDSIAKQAPRPLRYRGLAGMMARHDFQGGCNDRPRRTRRRI